MKRKYHIKVNVVKVKVLMTTDSAEWGFATKCWFGTKPGLFICPAEHQTTIRLPGTRGMEEGTSLGCWWLATPLYPASALLHIALSSDIPHLLQHEGSTPYISSDVTCITALPPCLHVAAGKECQSTEQQMEVQQLDKGE